jgi:hypothetical protein
MTREQFMALPQALQIRLLFDALDEETSRALLAQEAPAIPKPPRYDMAIYRSGGNSWASEHSLEGLIWWRNRYQQGANGGGQYADQDKKRVGHLDKWIAWRELFPSECWGGTRGEDQVAHDEADRIPAPGWAAATATAAAIKRRREPRRIQLLRDE